MFEFLSYPLHPMLVHFPIALFVTALVLESISLVTRKEAFHQSALILYIMAALISPWVARTGMDEAYSLNLVSHPVLDKHQLFANWTMWFSLMSLPVLWFLHKEFPKIFKWIFIVALMSVVCFVSLTGHFGGRMVYEYGVGVNF